MVRLGRWVVNKHYGGYQWFKSYNMFGKFYQMPSINGVNIGVHSKAKALRANLAVCKMWKIFFISWVIQLFCHPLPYVFGIYWAENIPNQYLLELYHETSDGQKIKVELATLFERTLIIPVVPNKPDGEQWQIRRRISASCGVKLSGIL